MPPSTYPLPDGWSKLEVVEDVVVVDGVLVHRAGLSSTGPSGEELTGAAVDAGASPFDRGYFELLERVSTVQALDARRASYELLDQHGEPVGRASDDKLFPESDEPARWRYARSNGVALHADWRSACQRAFWELAERDRVLRAWYGETRPSAIRFDPESTALKGSESYAWSAYSFPEPAGGGFSPDVEVVGVFGMPKRDDVPLVFGYGARPDANDALDAAVRESLQLLGFLWGEPLLDRLPEPSPTPSHHLEHFQWRGHRDLLQRWLEEGHERFRPPPGRHPVHATAPTVRFVDFTPTWLGEGLRVAKAVCEAAAPLAFGEAPFTAHLAAELRFHPIA